MKFSIQVLLGLSVLTFASVSFSEINHYPCNGAAGAFHTNPDSSIGGFVAHTATVDSSIAITSEASVCERATVLEGVTLSDRAKISGKATVRGKVNVAGRAEVYGEAYVINMGGEDLVINESAKIYGHAFLQGSVVVSGVSQVFGWGKVLEYAQVLGDSRICSSNLVKGYSVISDDYSLCPQFSK